MQKLWLVKARRFLRLWFLATRKGFFSPLFNRAELFQIIWFPVFIFIIYLAVGRAQMEEELTIWWAGTLAIVLSVPFWLLLNAIVAPFRVWKQEKEKGQWYGSRFVYNEPEPVYTLQVGPEDDGKLFTVKVKDAEPNTFARLSLSHDGGLAVGHLMFRLPRAVANRNTTTGVRLDDKRKTPLIVSIPSDSDATVIRIQMLSWEI